jgi:quercetin dioxygenase-like cupin family protein
MIDPPAIPPAASAAAGAGKLLPPGAGTTLHLLGDVATTKVAASETAGGLSVVEFATPVGGGVAEHVHPAGDETIYVLDGTFDVRVGGNRALLGAGGCAFVARSTVHGFTNVGDTPGRVLLISSPATHAQRVWMEMAAGLGKI